MGDIYLSHGISHKGCLTSAMVTLTSPYRKQYPGHSPP
jgi:hypothetical protein